MYFTDGQERVSDLDDYTSHNTERLTVPQVKDLLMKLEYIQQQLSAQINLAH
jgi:UDP-glucose 4-epimerase